MTTALLALLQQDMRKAESQVLRAATEEFQKRMADRLIQQQYKGRRGWDDPEWEHEHILERLYDMLEKGNPIDIANFCMFLHIRGWTAKGVLDIYNKPLMAMSSQGESK